MPAARPELTPQLIRDLCERIRAGAFEHVAAESLGVPATLYQRWLARGRARDAPRRYRELRQAVCQARGQARLMAEMDMRANDPKSWLLHGPGRDTAGRPGWTAAARPRPDEDTTVPNVLLHQEMMDLLHRLREGLLDLPDAQALVDRLLAAARSPSPHRAGRSPPASPEQSDS
jgi:hypothetical protein